MKSYVGAVAVLLIVGTGFGWYRTNLERAKQQGIAIAMARQAWEARQTFDSAVAAHDVVERQRAGRLARLALDSAANVRERARLAAAATSASQRADSILLVLVDSLPQLAGVQAAMDTLRMQVRTEADGRLTAEGKATELGSQVAGLENLLAQAKATIAKQAATIDQQTKAGSSGAGLNPLTAVLGVLVVGGAVVVGAVAF